MPGRVDFSGGEGDLEAVLEGGGRTGGGGEGRVEVAEVVGIGKGVALPRRVADGAEPCFDREGEARPAAEPAVGSGKRDGERGGGPGGVAGGCGGQGADEGEQLGGGQGSAGDDIVPMDGESAPAAGIRVAVRTEQAHPAGLEARVGLEVPVADHRIDAPTMDAPRGTQGDEEAEALHAARCRAAGELHGASVAYPANRPTGRLRIRCHCHKLPVSIRRNRGRSTAAEPPPEPLFNAILNNKIRHVEQ